jgi:hypothetical protein
MNMRELAAEYRLAHWVEIVRDRSARGLSIREYCKVSGIRENVYYYWQRKLRKVAYDSLSAQTEMVPAGLPSQSFTEIQVVESPPQSRVPEAEQPGQISIAVNGVHISAESAYPVEKLAALVRELSGSC